jgi:elongation factor G
VQYGHVIIDVAPGEKGRGIVVESEITGGAIPREYVRAATKGIRDACYSGPLGGYSMVDMKIVIRDGSYHEVDSSDMAFKIAASIGFKELAVKAKPIALEPVMSLEVVLPEEFLGEVIGDLSGRRGKIIGVEAHKGTQTIKAEAPLAGMFGYATDLRSLTQGRATYTMQFARYSPVPAAIMEAVITRHKGAGSTSSSKKKEVL